MLLTVRGVCPLVKELKPRLHSSVPMMAFRMSIRSRATLKSSHDRRAEPYWGHTWAGRVCTALERTSANNAVQGSPWASGGRMVVGQV